jgi:hypothetical protein
MKSAKLIICVLSDNVRRDRPSPSPSTSVERLPVRVESNLYLVTFGLGCETTAEARLVSMWNLR